MVPSLEGSYEGCPPTLADLIVRDRRWAQGNLQHLRLLSAQRPAFSQPGASRHGSLLLSRIANLGADTCWLASRLPSKPNTQLQAYFGSEASLFPKWPVFDAQKALTLFFATVLVVHLPKVTGGHGR